MRRTLWGGRLRWRRGCCQEAVAGLVGKSSRAVSGQALGVVREICAES